MKTTDERDLLLKRAMQLIASFAPVAGSKSFLKVKNLQEDYEDYLKRHRQETEQLTLWNGGNREY